MIYEVFWCATLTITNLMNLLSGHLSYGIILQLMKGLHFLLSPGDAIDALENIFHSHPGLLLFCHSSSNVMVPETSDEG